MLTSHFLTASQPSAVVSSPKKDANAAPTAASAVPTAAKALSESLPQKHLDHGRQGKHTRGSSDWITTTGMFFRGRDLALAGVCLRHG